MTHRKSIPSSKKTSRVPADAPPAWTARGMDPVYRLWDELNDFPAERIDSAVMHLMKTLAEWTGASGSRWLGLVRVMQGAGARKDILHGWRIRATHRFSTREEHYPKEVACLYDGETRLDEDLHVGMASRTLLADAGRFQVHRMRDGWIDYDVFRRSAHYRLYYQNLGLADRIWVSFPVNADTESIFILDRHRPARHFSARDGHLAGLVLRGVRGFHRRLFLDQGLLLGAAPLSPVERRITRKLLTKLSEKEIATELGQSRTTTHKYVTALYARFGVKSRAGLMGLWLMDSN